MALINNSLCSIRHSYKSTFCEIEEFQSSRNLRLAEISILFRLFAEHVIFEQFGKHIEVTVLIGLYYSLSLSSIYVDSITY